MTTPKPGLALHGSWPQRRAVPAPGPHEFTLRFGDERETIIAASSTEAVAQREHRALPDSITDETHIRLWLAQNLDHRTGANGQRLLSSGVDTYPGRV